ncbi:MAG: hypothetical protein JWP89_5352 [Schlesneria sp.]|nr:hypothetical protein [Schlesneria sp.]
MNVPLENVSTASPHKTQEISGKAVVLGMLALGICATATLFIYFELHTGPFRPLREAIGREFKHSRPNVEGGRVRGRGPWILRISMSVPFDPYLEEAQAEQINERVLEIAQKFENLPTFEQIQVNLIYFAPEKEAVRRTFDWPPKPPAKKAEGEGLRAK